MQKLHRKCRVDIVLWNKGFKDLDPLNSMLALSGNIEYREPYYRHLQNHTQPRSLRSQNPETNQTWNLITYIEQYATSKAASFREKKAAR